MKVTQCVSPKINKIKTLICACCGKECKGRQWWNRDTGYGLCFDCSQWLKSREDSAIIEFNYGKEGVHFNIKKH